MSQAVHAKPSTAVAWPASVADGLLLVLDPGLTLCVHQLLERALLRQRQPSRSRARGAVAEPPGLIATFVLAAVSKTVASAVLYPLHAAIKRPNSEPGPKSEPGPTSRPVATGPDDTETVTITVTDEDADTQRIDRITVTDEDADTQRIDRITAPHSANSVQRSPGNAESAARLMRRLWMARAMWTMGGPDSGWLAATVRAALRYGFAMAGQQVVYRLGLWLAWTVAAALARLAQKRGVPLRDFSSHTVAAWQATAAAEVATSTAPTAPTAPTVVHELLASPLPSPPPSPPLPCTQMAETELLPEPSSVQMAERELLPEPSSVQMAETELLPEPSSVQTAQPSRALPEPSPSRALLQTPPPPPTKPFRTFQQLMPPPRVLPEDLSTQALFQSWPQTLRRATVSQTLPDASSPPSSQTLSRDLASLSAQQISPRALPPSPPPSAPTTPSPTRGSRIPRIARTPRPPLSGASSSRVVINMLSQNQRQLTQGDLLPVSRIDSFSPGSRKFAA